MPAAGYACQILNFLNFCILLLAFDDGRKSC